MQVEVTIRWLWGDQQASDLSQQEAAVSTIAKVWGSKETRSFVRLVFFRPSVRVFKRALRYDLHPPERVTQPKSFHPKDVTACRACGRKCPSALALVSLFRIRPEAVAELGGGSHGEDD